MFINQIQTTWMYYNYVLIPSSKNFESKSFVKGCCTALAKSLVYALVLVSHDQVFLCSCLFNADKSAMICLR